MVRQHHLPPYKLNMSSNTFAKIIAVAGAGGFVGVEIVKALFELGGFEVRILVRASSVSNLSTRVTLN